MYVPELEKQSINQERMKGVTTKENSIFLGKKLKYDKTNILCRNEDSGITVLSLCDGMSCGQMAFEKAGIKVKNISQVK